MLIERLDIYHVASPLLAPYNTAFGDTDTVEKILVRLESEGLVGWGEGAPWSSPFYSPEWGAGAYDIAGRFLAPEIIGKEIESGPALQQVFKPVKGNYFAKAAFDLALWDWQARKADVPLWKYLGGSQGVADVGAAFGVAETVEDLLRGIEGAVVADFPRIKLKIKPGWDVDVLRQVRQEFPDAVFHVDANSGYTLEDADVFRALDELNLAMFEQPLSHDDLLDHAELARMVSTPICLDESITSARRAQQAIDLGACDFINIKPGRVGGITNSVEILKVASDANVPCWIGGMLESAVGVMPCLALATLPGMGYSHDFSPTRRFWPRDLADREIVMHAPGKIAAFEGAGIGCAPDENQLRAETIQHCTF